MSHLDIDQVNVYISNIHILKDLSLEMREGEITSIIGSNGAGKSTLLNTISGMITVRKGEIRFQGNILKGSPNQIVEMGIIQVPEGRHLLPYMTVLENLQIGSYIKRARAKRKETLEFVFDLFPILVERKGQLAKTLSGGEQQMLAIGRGLMAIPKLLMLDEPSLGLAPLMVETIFKTFQKINQEGKTILLVEQNVRKSLAVSQRGYVLENGKVVLEGEAEELSQNAHIKKAYLGI
jgi:branched-chain amino acid transport system ATP-binding protein